MRLCLPVYAFHAATNSQSKGTTVNLRVGRTPESAETLICELALCIRQACMCQRWRQGCEINRKELRVTCMRHAAQRSMRRLAHSLRPSTFKSFTAAMLITGAKTVFIGPADDMAHTARGDTLVRRSRSRGRC